MTGVGKKRRMGLIKGAQKMEAQDIISLWGGTCVIERARVKKGTVVRRGKRKAHESFVDSWRTKGKGERHDELHVLRRDETGRTKRKRVGRRQGGVGVTGGRGEGWEGRGWWGCGVEGEGGGGGGWGRRGRVWRGSGGEGGGR